MFFSSSLDDTKKLAKKIKNNIFPFSNILIFGEMWAWKTHFIKYLLKELWVDQNIKSPTYGYSNYYKSGNLNIWHYDLYRLKGEDLNEIHEHFFSCDDIVITEWAEKIKDKPKARIEVYIKKLSDNERSFEVKFFGTSLPKKEINKLIKKYKTPLNVLQHSAQVTMIADRIVKNLEAKWNIIDSWLVHSAASLHDLVRYVDFKWWIDRDKMGFEVSDEDYKFWTCLRSKHEPAHHSDVAWEILEHMWYLEIWRVIRSHCTYQIFRWLDTIEEKIVYYADKRVLHDRVVSIKQRLSDGKVRYHWEWNDEYWRQLEEKLLDLEKDLLIDF